MIGPSDITKVSREQILREIEHVQKIQREYLDNQRRTEQSWGLGIYDCMAEEVIYLEELIRRDKSLLVEEQVAPKANEGSQAP